VSLKELLKKNILLEKFIGLIVDKPIFVVGCGHSGTSIMLRLLGEHSRILAIPVETNIFMRSNAFFTLKEILRWEKACLKQGKYRLAEKTPKHIHKLKRILRGFPDAKIILMVRDGRDVAISFKQRLGNIDAGIDRWVRDNRAALPFHDHPQVKIVRYEDLVKFPETTIKEALSFLGEEYEYLLDFHNKKTQWYSKELHKPKKLSGKDHNTYRNWQINQPLSTERVNRWKREMTEEEKALFKQKASWMLTRLEYESHE